MTFTQIEQEELVVGRPLPWDVFDATHARLLRKGAIIRQQEQLNALFARGLYRLAAPGESSQAAGQNSPHTAVANPFTLIDRTRALLAGALGRHASADGSPFAESIYRICHLLRMACLTNKDAAIASIMVKPWPSYAIKHMIDAAIIVEIVTRGMGVGAEERLSMMAAALTMNLGMLDLQVSIHHRLGSPSPQQMEQIRLHPVLSHNMLIDKGVADRIWLDAVLQHHELLDGTGYPTAISGEAISVGGRILCIADVFSAWVCPRGDRSNAMPSAVMREIFLMRDMYDVDIAARLVKHIGICPAGTLLKLQSGEAAIVVRQGDNVQRPLAAVLTDVQAQSLVSPVELEVDVHAAKVITTLKPDVAIPLEAIEKLWLQHK